MRPRRCEDLNILCYYNTVIKKEKVEYLTEKQMENGMLCIDFDFRYDISVKTRQHTLENIEEYLDILLNVLKTLLVIENIEFEVYIFEKDNVNICEKENTTKDGIHIIIGLNVINNLKIILREKFLSEIVNVSELIIRKLFVYMMKNCKRTIGRLWIM